MKKAVRYLKKQREKIILLLLVFLAVFTTLFYIQQSHQTKSQLTFLTNNLERTKKELTDLKNQDQYKINKDLEAKIAKTEDVYKKTSEAYEKIIDLKAQKQKNEDLDKQFAEILNNLSQLNYSSASSNLFQLKTGIDKQYQILAQASISTGGTNQVAAVTSNQPPASGYSFQSVQTDSGTFNVSIVAADLNSTRVIVDTASDSTCKDNCPVMSLGDYVGRNGAYAGINGSFFCPTEYPSCSGKTNSFDTLLMNKNKVYFNSDNNVYSTIPAVIFKDNWVRFVGRSLDWGRDTSVDAVLANFPLYISGGNIVFGGSGDAKLNNKGPRTFIANKGNFAYIGVIYSATSDDAAKVLKTLGFDNALGLDQGGSTALWFNGYKAGPGRNIPNALLFVRK